MSREMRYVIQLAVAGALSAIAIDYFVKPSINRAVRLR